jgi:hypothetical protein
MNLPHAPALLKYRTATARCNLQGAENRRNHFRF